MQASEAFFYSSKSRQKHRRGRLRGSPAQDSPFSAIGAVGGSMDQRQGKITSWASSSTRIAIVEFQKSHPTTRKNGEGIVIPKCTAFAICQSASHTNAQVFTCFCSTGATYYGHECEATAACPWRLHCRFTCNGFDQTLPAIKGMHC